MRRVLTAAVTAVLATAAAAGAAPSRGLTFTDPAGDADFTGGRATAVSQASYDVLRVTLSSTDRTKKTSSVLVHLDLAATAATAVGTTYYVSGTQGACSFTVSRTATVEGWVDGRVLTCGSTPTSGGYSSSSVTPVTAAAGRTVTFVVPAEQLVDARLGAKLTAIEAGTALADPVTGAASAVRVDSATHPGPYLVGR